MTPPNRSFERHQKTFSVCTEDLPRHHGMPPRKKGTKSTAGRGAAAQEASEQPVRVVEDAPVHPQSEAETTGHPPASQMDIVAEVNQPAALFHYCISLLHQSRVMSIQPSPVFCQPWTGLISSGSSPFYFPDLLWCEAGWTDESILKVGLMGR